MIPGTTDRANRKEFRRVRSMVLSVQIGSAGAWPSRARVALGSKHGLAAGPSTVQRPASFLALFPAVPFWGALGFWLHNFVLPVFALCFSFPVPSRPLVLSLYTVLHHHLWSYAFHSGSLAMYPFLREIFPGPLTESNLSFL